MTFGKKFKELRLEKGLLQQDLADDFNKIYGHTFTKSSISQYENGKRMPEIEALKDFALYFNVSIDYLLGIDDNQNIATESYSEDKVLDLSKQFFMDSNISRSNKDKVFQELSQLYFNSLI